MLPYHILTLTNRLRKLAEEKNIKRNTTKVFSKGSKEFSQEHFKELIFIRCLIHVV